MEEDKYIHSCTGVGYPVDDQVWLKHVVDLETNYFAAI
jgi:hypothetical protein